MPFSQSKDIYKVYFNTKYKYIEIFEELFNENMLSTSQYEVESSTIESLPDDIWCFEAYLNLTPDYYLIQKQINEFANATGSEVIGNIGLEKVEDKDWVAFYHEQLKPIEIGNFFIGVHSHQNLCPKDKVGVFIEASRAFGSGGHDTTAGCIEEMTKLSHLQFNNIIDIGTGSGILSLVAEKIWPKAKIVGCDIDEVSIEIANHNKIFNNSKIELYNNSADTILSPEYSGLKFDLVISNILANPLIKLSAQIKNLSQKNSYIILSGFLEYQLNDIIDAYQTYGFEIYEIIYKDSWVILTLYQITN